MKQNNPVENVVPVEENQKRREFLKRVGKTSVAVPAAALLIAASQEKASATPVSGAACRIP
jgi:hypothetical protein